MAIHRLSIDDFEENEYSLIAIHTSLEDYYLAYQINRHLALRVYKIPESIQITTKNGEAHFSRYTFEDPDRGGVWNLLQNKSEVISMSASGDLFGQNSAVSTRVHFLPEFKRVDYILKVENHDDEINDTLNRFRKIDKVSTVYPVDINQIKSKNNLIF